MKRHVHIDMFIGRTHGAAFVGFPATRPDAWPWTCPEKCMHMSMHMSRPPAGCDHTTHPTHPTRTRAHPIRTWTTWRRSAVLNPARSMGAMFLHAEASRSTHEQVRQMGMQPDDYATIASDGRVILLSDALQTRQHATRNRRTAERGPAGDYRRESTDISPRSMAGAVLRILKCAWTGCIAWGDGCTP